MITDMISKRFGGSWALASGAPDIYGMYACTARARGSRPLFWFGTRVANAVEPAASAAITSGMSALAVGITEGAGQLAAAPPETATAPPTHGS